MIKRRLKLISKPIFVMLVLCFSFFFSLCLAVDSIATLRPPVMVKIISEESIRVGKQMTFHVLLQGNDFPEASIQIIIPKHDWQLVGGETIWAGSIKAGIPVQFVFDVIPTVENPQPIRGLLSLKGWPDTEWGMNIPMPQVPAQDIDKY